MRVVVDDRGRIVIPKEVRRKLGIAPGSVLRLRVEEESVVLEVEREKPSERLAKLLKGFEFSRAVRKEAEEWLLRKEERAR